MSPTRHFDPKREAADTAAADWLIAHDRGLSSEEEAQFGRWINESHLHAQAWAAARDAWSQLDRLPELPEDTLTRSADWHVVSPAEISSEETSAPKKFSAKILMPWAAALAVIAGGVWWWQVPATHSTAVPLEAPTAARVVTVSPRKIFLPDGSRVELNAGGQIVEEFTGAERHVRLVRGEAHFTVTKDPSRPFVVDADGVAVRAVGTAFNVKLASAAVEVIVTEGTVRLDETHAGAVIPRANEELAHDSSFLDAGRRAVISLHRDGPPAAEISAVSPEEIRAALAWQAVRLKFVDLSLDRVAAEFNRLNQTQLVVDPSARDTLVAGTFRADNVAVFADFMERGFGLSVDRRADGTIWLSKAP